MILLVHGIVKIHFSFRLYASILFKYTNCTVNVLFVTFPIRDYLSFTDEILSENMHSNLTHQTRKTHYNYNNNDNNNNVIYKPLKLYTKSKRI